MPTFYYNITAITAWDRSICERKYVWYMFVGEGAKDSIPHFLKLKKKNQEIENISIILRDTAFFKKEISKCLLLKKGESDTNSRAFLKHTL